MVNRVQTLRSSVAGNRPPAGHQPGELYVNFPEGQFGVINSSSANQDLLGVTIFSTSANYAIGALVAYQGNLYRATAASTAGAFVAANWALVLTNGVSSAVTFSGGLTVAGGFTASGAIALGSGNLTSTGNATLSNTWINTATNAYGSLIFQSSGSARWTMGKDNSADSSPSNGANFVIGRYQNSPNNVIDYPLSIARATGIVTLADGLSVTAGGVAVVAGASSFGAAVTGPTASAGDNSTNLATTAFVRNRGMQSSGQTLISTSQTLTQAQAGSNLLIQTAGLTITFPSLVGTFCLSNISSGDTTLAYTGTGPGSDYGTVLHPGCQVVLAGDGNGFWRVVSAGTSYQVGSVLLNEAVTSGNAASVNFTSIPQNFRHLRLKLMVQSSQSGVTPIYGQFNGDNAGDYNYTYLLGTGGAASSGSGNGTTTASIGNISNWSPAVFVWDIFGYSQTAFAKAWVVTVYMPQNGSTTSYVQSNGGIWYGVGSTNPITSILIFPNAGYFVNGGIFSLYGEY